MKTLLLTLCLSLAAFSAPRAETVHFVTEEYAPFNYSKDGRITGIAVEQVEAMAKAAGIDYTLEIMPWARAFALAEKQPMHCVFTTGYNRERAGRFVWINPLLKDQMVLLKRKDDGRDGLTLAEAMELKVGSQRDDFAVEALSLMGFKNIDLATDIDLTVRKLLSGRIDLMPTSIKTYRKMVKDGLPVEKAMMMAGQVYGIACQKDMPHAIVERLQAELDKLILNGEQDRIFTAYGLPPNARTAENDAGK
ncbi:substrate-binding periplasmic protein [Shinella fusca]|jgi:polar amino acid transport system substrate-binding protein|uniref:Polar amino acid transport system substrate-binding protein n=1 Tax=Shinella fusca TaxID=544480 RepID=A0A7W7YUI2_9HYPH|nr:transporter substrate-binding domain-containing protein [Shinella fusca]MBB5042502.1 polar amino acid transport system substrate-binding protein [Shinella fusca]